MQTSIRVRAIVKRASQMTQDPEVQTWILWDEKGTFETFAREKLAEVEAKGELPTGISEDDVDEVIAVHLALLAIEGAISLRTKQVQVNP